MQYEAPTQPSRQRLTRSTRDKMWAGVAGGLAEYFDLDPVVMRLIWIAAAILTGGLAIPVYLVMWWVMPRADEPVGAGAWRAPAAGASTGWGEAPAAGASTGWGAAPTSGPGDLGGDLGGDVAAPSATATDPGASAPTDVGASAPSGFGPSAPSGFGSTGSSDFGSTGATGFGPIGAAPTSGPTGYTSTLPPTYEAPPWLDHRRRRQRTAGVIMIALGMIFLAGQLGLFAWFGWRYFWPLVLIAIGAGLLFRQNAWRR